MAVTINPKFLDELDKLEEPEQAQKEQEYIKWWKPENAGDSIAGILKEVKTVDTDYGKKRCAVLDTPDGVYEVTLSTMLAKAWDKEKPAKGDLVGIKYLGTGTGETGNTFKKHLLKVQKTADTDPFEDE